MTVSPDRLGASRLSLLPGFLRSRGFRHWVIPVITVGTAGLLRFLMGEALLNEAPFLMLLTAVGISAYFGSFKSGMFATVLALVVALAFMHPPFDFLAQPRPRQFRTFIFIGEGSVITLLCSALNKARDRAEFAVEESRKLQQQLSDAADREQLRIGQDLHDDLGQFLTGVALFGENHARHLQTASPEVASEARQLVHMINESINRTRQLARGLAPITIEPDSLVLLLAELQERTAEASKREILFDVKGNPPDLPRPIVLQLYRIAQEAVGNALRHSQATRIEILLSIGNRRIVMEIIDNGRGIASDDFGRGNGMGLSVMGFRARSIGGQLEIRRGSHAAPDQGTTIYFEIPIPSVASR